MKKMLLLTLLLCSNANASDALKKLNDLIPDGILIGKSLINNSECILMKNISSDRSNEDSDEISFQSKEGHLTMPYYYFSEKISQVRIETNSLIVYNGRDFDDWTIEEININRVSSRKLIISFKEISIIKRNRYIEVEHKDKCLFKR